MTQPNQPAPHPAPHLAERPATPPSSSSPQDAHPAAPPDSDRPDASFIERSAARLYRLATGDDFDPTFSVERPVSLTRRLRVAAVGIGCMLFGIVISPLPGPGLSLFGPAGLMILATEFKQARRAQAWLFKHEASLRARLDGSLARVSRWWLLPVIIVFWGAIALAWGPWDAWVASLQPAAPVEPAVPLEPITPPPTTPDALPAADVKDEPSSLQLALRTGFWFSASILFTPIAYLMLRVWVVRARRALARRTPA